MQIKQSVTSTKNFVKKHRVAIAVITTTTVLVSLQIRNANHLNAFLAEHDLYEEYVKSWNIPE